MNKHEAVHEAIHFGLLWGLAFSSRRSNHPFHKPGSVIERMSDEIRAELRNLKSEDLSNIRYDLLDHVIEDEV